MIFLSLYAIIKGKGVERMEKYYLSTPIYYPSGYLHIGNTYTTIVADMLKRYKELQGMDVYFVTGSDEHGEKIQKNAEKAGVTPLEFVTNINKEIYKLWDLLDIRYDKYIRTSDKSHDEMVKKIFTRLYEQGDIYKGEYEGLYCTPCESFWTESQLVDGKCPDCGREVHPAHEEAYFFRLSNYKDRLLKYYEEHPEFIEPESKKTEMINNFFKEGLQDLCVSRTSFDWGVQVPFDPKHVVYVWIDALSSYIDAAGYLQDDEKFKKLWPADIHLVGKDILRFHVIIWPALLMALDLPLPKKVFAHGWILFESDKMSKSKGNVIYPEPIVKLYGRDALKYYVMREFNFGSDGNFQSKKFMERVNSDLANDLGNLVSRTIAMAEKYFGGTVNKKNSDDEIDKDLIDVALTRKAVLDEKMEHLNLSVAIDEVFKLIRRSNKYIDETCPWTLNDDEHKERLETIIYNLLEALRISSVLLSPFIPDTAKKIREALGLSEEMKYEECDEFGLVDKYTVKKIDTLFPRLDVDKEVERLLTENENLIKSREEKDGKAKAEDADAKPAIEYDDFAKLDLRLGEVIDSKEHPEADKLLINTIKIGDETRTIVSGIKKWYKPEDIIGKKVVVVCNLKPRKIRGVESQGMILACENGDDLSLVTSLEDMPSGSVIA